MMQTVIEISDLKKRYGKTAALGGVSFSISAGEIFGLLGPNGAGKTTLIKILCGLGSADSGEVRLFGKHFQADDREMRRLIGIGTQDLSIYPDLSARENLRFFGKIYGFGGADLKNRIDKLLVDVGLEDRADDRAGTFSGGMKRRLNLAVAVIHQPRILFLDEPTTGVDPQSRNRIFDQVKALNASGMTIVYTSHYMEEVELLCNRIAVIDSGKLLACNSITDLLKAQDRSINLTISTTDQQFISKLVKLPGVKSFEIQQTGINLIVQDVGPVLAKVALACATAGIELLSVATNESTLERLFLQITGRALRD